MEQNHIKQENVKLTSLVKTSGCAAKIGPAILHEVLGHLPKFDDPRLLVGYEGSDDACVYQVSDNLVSIQTVDFFPPMVDDPYLFGQIAAANALSDIYAMGGNPATALNLLCFPACLLPPVMEAILAGGYDKVREAGAVIAGGHTISDPTPKYGLCVTGYAHPQDILTNSGAKTGDLLILTKPLGSGILNTAAKAELIEASQQNELHNVMCTLNRAAKEAVTGLQIHACTDVTGFSLIGHAYEMASGSQKSISIHSSEVPFMNGVLEYASMGIIPEGMYNNLDYLKDQYQTRQKLPQNLLDALFDPQTSGGLLLAMPEKDAMEYLSRMQLHSAWPRIIGEVSEMQDAAILIQS